MSLLNDKGIEMAHNKDTQLVAEFSIDTEELLNKIARLLTKKILRSETTHGITKINVDVPACLESQVMDLLSDEGGSGVMRASDAQHKIDIASYNEEYESSTVRPSRTSGINPDWNYLR